MMRFVIRLLNSISRRWKLDLLWRTVNHMPRRDRVHLTSRLLDHLDIEEVTFRHGDTLWTCYGWDASITPSLLDEGHFQGREVHAIVAWMKQNAVIGADRNVIVDVGANIGTTCIPSAQTTDCRILAIEPVSDNFRLLRKNAENNGLSGRITCVRKAVFAEPGTIDMVVPRRESGGAFIHERPSEAPVASRRVVKVPSDGLTNIITSEGFSPEQIAFVWSDTEGSETNVIQTGQALWQSGVPLYIEVYPEALERQGNLGALNDLVARHFDRFLISDDIIERGADAKHHPVSEFANFVDRVGTTVRIEDVLLLPQAYEVQG